MGQVGDERVVVPEILVAEGEGQVAAHVVGDRGGGGGGEGAVGAEGGDVVDGTALEQAEVEELEFLAVEFAGGGKRGMAGLEVGAHRGERALAVFEEGMDDGDVHPLGAAFDVDGLARHAESGQEGRLAVARGAVDDGEEYLGRTGADEGQVGIGDVALDDA